MADNNPFISITSSEKDIIVDRANEKIELLILINEALEHGGIIVLKGGPGMGKSTLLNAIEKELKKSSKISLTREEFTPAVYNKIRSLNVNHAKKTLLILDDFNNIEMLDRISQQRVIDLLYNLSQNISILIVENREGGVEKELEKQGRQFDKYSLEGLSREDLKKVVINRLNSVRERASDSLDPFSGAEYDRIYKKSRGNPRISLLICSALYDQKTNNII